MPSPITKMMFFGSARTSELQRRTMSGA